MVVVPAAATVVVVSAVVSVVARVASRARQQGKRSLNWSLIF